MTTDYAALRTEVGRILTNFAGEVYLAASQHRGYTSEQPVISQIDALYQRQVESLVDEVIGVDEKGLPIDDFYRSPTELDLYYRDRNTRDELRAEQRERFEKLKGEK